MFKRYIILSSLVLLFLDLYSRAYFVSSADTNHNGKDVRANEVSELLTNYKVKVDSILFKRGEKFYLNITMLKIDKNNVFFGAYGDQSLPKPILDGSNYRFNFDSETWKDHVIIRGVKFYKKQIKGLAKVENVYSNIKMLTLAREPDIDEVVVEGQKNSFKGFFQIDSVDSKSTKSRFFDFDNIVDWSGAELVTKTRQWTYERRLVQNDGHIFETDEDLVYNFNNKWGYFVRRHFSALDTKGEWFYNKPERVLYFSPLKDKCSIYISSNKEDHNSGFDLSYKKNIKIENISFVNYKHGIKLKNSKDITINNCDFRNCTYGIVNKTSYLERIKVENCYFRNMHSYAIRLIANNSLINNNDIDSVGLTFSSESKGFDNLDGIESYGKNNIISNNVINNTGYCGIRIYNCSGTKVLNNHVENTDLMVADGGAIYSYNSMDGNKLIKGNTVINSFGNVSGTTGDKDHASGIYLDELSMHFKVDSNYISNCGDGIYIQNSRSDTIINNVVEKNRKTGLHINHAGSILNGGRLNPENDPGFDPEDLSFIPTDYTWDNEEGLLFYKKKQNGVVYLKPGNNLVKDNKFIPSDDKYTFTFRTWGHINKYLIENLTGNKDFFNNNIPDSLVQGASLLIVGGNVKDHYQSGKYFDNIKNSFDKTVFDFLRKVHIYIGYGNKYVREK